MNKNFMYKFLEWMVGKKFANEVWYNYLTGESASEAVHANASLR